MDEIEATRRGILERLPFTPREVLAYQSRTGPVNWIGPGTEGYFANLKITFKPLPLSMTAVGFFLNFPISVR